MSNAPLYIGSHPAGTSPHTFTPVNTRSVVFAPRFTLFSTQLHNVTSFSSTQTYCHIVQFPPGPCTKMKSRHYLRIHIAADAIVVCGLETICIYTCVVPEHLWNTFGRLDHSSSNPCFSFTHVLSCNGVLTDCRCPGTVLSIFYVYA